MYRIALCEDDPRDRALFVESLAAAFASIERPYTLSCFESGEAFLSAVRPYEYDLVFFDVEMRHLSGIETAKRLREVDRFVIIVFTTVHAGGVFSSFTVEPLHYLVKPVTEDALSPVVRKAVTKIDEARAAQFAFTFNGTVQSIPTRRIVYFESKGRTVDIVTSNARLSFYDTLNNIEKNPLLASFVRCHQSYLVNPGFIKSIGADEIALFNGSSIPLSRKRAKEAKARFLEYATNGER